MGKIISTDWYKHLIEECRAILSETHFSASICLLEGKWQLGKRITEEELNSKRAGYGKKIVEMVAKELNISSAGLWKCVQFYKKFPEKQFDLVVPKLDVGTKTPTWHLVCQKILPQSKDNEIIESICEHINLICLKCRKRFNMNELNSNETQRNKIY